ncbi:MAG TPA: 2-dehydropantoate 2-reductase, partial [Gemmatimonadaceae bacterium]|nr:2-dehydropantoate 2-reductase [Gemmatimonadaceae bacterium]
MTSETPKRQSIAILGLGSIGGIAAATLADADRHDVIGCARRPLDGLTLETPERTIKAPLRVLSDPATAAPVDWVLLATKAQDTEAVAPWLTRLCTPATRVAVLQNGVEQRENVAPFVPTGTTIVPVVVRAPTRRTAPGVVTSEESAALTAPDDDAGRAFASLFHGSRVSATVTSDFVTEAWSKLCLNAANGAIMALTERNLDVMREPKIAELARALVRECVAVGRAEGANLDDGLADDLVAKMASSSHAETRGNSMYYDRIDGRAMEWD